MTISLSWPAALAITAGLTSLSLLVPLWPYRDRPGAMAFAGTIGCLSLWGISYGLGLAVFDPELRRLFEIPIWVGINFVGVFFLAFALRYTGRGRQVTSTWFRAVVGLQGLHTLIVLTNSIHGIAWRGYRIDPVFGAAAVEYVHQPWLFLNVGGIAIMVATGGFLLFDTVLSYGPLYRKQAFAVALSPVPPGIAFLAWLFELGPVPALNVTPFVFPLHLGLDLYALFAEGMFDLTPATRRVGERAAIDDLGTPVVLLDEAGRINDLNGAAATAFGLDSDRALGRPFDTLFEDPPDLDSNPGTVTIERGGRRGIFAVATNPIEDATGARVGRTVALQDVTEERRREQRLAVLNRVLRHNLRNDLGVVKGAIETVQGRVEDDDLDSLLAMAAESTDDVLSLGEKARTIERAMEADPTDETVELAEILESIAAELEPRYDGTIELEVPAGVSVRANRRLLASALRNLIENGLEHASPDRPTVSISLDDGAGETVTIVLRDEGPGIPDQELEVLAAGAESDLRHGSGLGLWFTTWAVDAIGGDIDFETGPGGTTVRLSLPAAS